MHSHVFRDTDGPEDFVKHRHENAAATDAEKSGQKSCQQAGAASSASSSIRFSVDIASGIRLPQAASDWSSRPMPYSASVDGVTQHVDAGGRMRVACSLRHGDEKPAPRPAVVEAEDVTRNV